MSDPDTDYSSSFLENALKQEILSKIVTQKANACPMGVRLAWHSSGTYDAKDGSGGSNGATMVYDPESTDGANAGLNIMRDILLPVSKAFPNVSKADIWAVAGAASVEHCGGPAVPVTLGRTDKDATHCPPNGRLPDAAQGAQHLRDVFYRMGFDDKEIVALSGAHTLGRCHESRSGFDGPWTKDPLKFDNSYYTNLLELEWTPRKWDGPLQYQDPSGKLMMLPTDLALVQDDKFKPWVKKYAKDQALFRQDFSAAFSKILALGCPAAAAKKEKVNKEDEASMAFREHAMHGSLEHCKEAVAKGANVHAKEASSGRTAMHKAAFWGHDHLIKYMTEDLKMDVNATDYNGDTALHDASRFGHMEVIKILLANGAKPGIRNNSGQTAVDVAREYNKPEVITAIRGPCTIL